MTEQIVDAYEEHIAKLRERRAQQPEDEKHKIEVSDDGLHFIMAACDYVAGKTPEMKSAKDEVERVVMAAMRKRIEEQDGRQPPTAHA